MRTDPESAGQPSPSGAGAPGQPPAAGRATFQAELDRLRRPIAQWPRLGAGRSDDLGTRSN